MQPPPVRHHVTQGLLALLVWLCLAGATPVYTTTAPLMGADYSGMVSKLFTRGQEDITEEERGRAKELTKGRMLLRMEDTRAVAGWLGAQELLLNQIRTVDEVDLTRYDQLLMPGESRTYTLAAGMATVDPSTGVPVKPETGVN